MHHRRSGRGNPPTVTNGILYAGSNDGKLYAFNNALGMPIWNFTTGGYVTSGPAVSNGVVYFGSYDHNVLLMH
jgi:outer membrane protein assembly factor BamB